ncbi:hypothetical protein AMD27_16620 (plasmid) [Acinetobacter sp. TGL-Y2]|uniref:hypothetical protein n=1 Tax=Acinetobacter sp. TGL-Y2 TaxID=1407071 RepID=UPI0007A66E39|nr:hypothetical protein [Acinetobacter sp. TGL-Y2]AMW80540.1 hypothetical protein AMD27_16620 [Acinetobacter sp. TGL-Y2]
MTLTFDDAFEIEIVSCFYRVGRKSYVSEKYGITIAYLNSLIRKPEYSEVNIKKKTRSLKKISRYREIIQYFEISNDRLATAKKFGLKLDEFDHTLSKMRKSIFYNSENYNDVISYLNGFRQMVVDNYTKEPTRKNNELLMKLEIALGKSVKDIKFEYEID